MNLALENEQATIRERCTLRSATLAEAQSKCDRRASCEGITRDAGLVCGNGRHLEYEMRTRKENKNVRRSSSLP